MPTGAGGDKNFRGGGPIIIAVLAVGPSEDEEKGGEVRERK